MSEEQQEPRSLKEHIAHLRGPGTKTVSDDLRSADEIERLTTENRKLWAVVDAVKDMKYADAVAGAELWGRLQELLVDVGTDSSKQEQGND